MTKPILYAEDDENDAFFMERVFGELKIANPLRVVPDGKAAIAYLSGEGPYLDREKHPLPALILLDLSMPGKGGLEVLQWARNLPALASIPIIVLTSSNQQTDVHRAKILGANGYLIKPGDPDELQQLVQEIHTYWVVEEHPRTAFEAVGRTHASVSKKSGLPAV